MSLDRVSKIADSQRAKITIKDAKELIPALAGARFDISAVGARALIKIVTWVFKQSCNDSNISKKSSRALLTKFRDAGRRSPPWKPTSSRIPGRPQDGSDGNRINRWLLPDNHKYYANEIIATLVEVKYILQTLSMANAPVTELTKLTRELFTPWLLEHEVKPGRYLDPIQLAPIDFIDISEDPRLIQSGHLFPLDRGGKHHPSNSFLMLSRSNQIQGNQTVEELLELMSSVVERHERSKIAGSKLEELIRQKI